MSSYPMPFSYYKNFQTNKVSPPLDGFMISTLNSFLERFKISEKNVRALPYHAPALSIIHTQPSSIFDGPRRRSTTQNMSSGEKMSFCCDVNPLARNYINLLDIEFNFIFNFLRSLSFRSFPVCLCPLSLPLSDILSFFLSIYLTM